MEQYKELIDRCLKNDVAAQEQFYKQFSAKMYGICMRYVRERSEAADLLQEGFVKAFDKLNDYRGEGSFEGWMRRIFVNTAINHYKSNLRKARETDDIPVTEFVENDALSNLSTEELLGIINSLPDGYRMVFNMYVIEGFDHNEIASMLGINEASSRSQLLRARKTLQERVKKHYNILSYEQAT